MSSPFTSKLGTNYCPTDQEVAEINRLLIEPTLQLQRLDAEIAALQKAMDKLTKERSQRAEFVDGYRALISPIRRLPLDVIQEIFCACLPTDRNCDMSASEAPVLLGRICSSWRSISLSTPSLWSRLHVVEPIPRGMTSGASPVLFDMVHKKQALHLSAIKTWLGRSGACPLALSLEIPFYHHRVPENVCRTTLMQGLLLFSARWQHIRLWVAQSVLEAIGPLRPANFPILRSIAVLLYSNGPEPFNWKDWGILGAPRISSLRLSGTNVAPGDLPVRWNKLTELSLDPTYRSTFSESQANAIALKILSECPELRECSLVHPHHWLTETKPAITFPFLHTLRLLCNDNTPLSSGSRTLMLDDISAPLLRNFVLQQYGDGGDYAPSIIRFLAAATFLQNVEIQSETFTKPQLLRLVSVLPPTLQRLKIHSRAGPRTPHSVDSLVDESDDDLLELVTPVGASVCCPGLVDLTLDDRTPHLSDAAILRFVRARMAPDFSPRLRHVQLKLGRERSTKPTDMGPELELQLQPFVDVGLKISIAYKPTAAVSFSPWLGLPQADSWRF